MCVNWFIDAKCGLLCVVCLSPPAFSLHRWVAHLIYMGLGGGLPLDTWHARSIGVWICPDVHEQAPSYG